MVIPRAPSTISTARSSGCMWAPAITPWSSTCLGIGSLSGRSFCSRATPSASVTRWNRLRRAKRNRPAQSRLRRRPANRLTPTNRANETACRCRLLSSVRSRCVYTRRRAGHDRWREVGQRRFGPTHRATWIGVHNIEIRQDGFRTFVTDITIRPNETTPLNVAMTRQ